MKKAAAVAAKAAEESVKKSSTEATDADEEVQQKGKTAKAVLEKLPAKEKAKKLKAKAAASPKLTPEDQDAANEEKSEVIKKAQAIQDAASTAKKDLDTKTDAHNTAKLNKESAEEVKKGEAEIEVKTEVKKAKAKAQAPKPAELEQPWGSPSEVWTANMPAHHLEGFAQQDKKENMKEHELAQS